MLRFLFGRLTDQPRRAQTLFERIVAEARRPLWFTEGEVADSIDGRFAMLATICAMVIVRLETGPEEGSAASVALTERFVEAMDAEHREIGLNDPGLGRRVRKLVGSLERRVDEWRDATSDESDWTETIVSSVYKGAPPRDSALQAMSSGLRDLWERLSATTEARVAEGQF